MARLTLEKLTRFRTLRDFFAKFSPDFEKLHLHAEGFQNVNNFGGNSWLNLWSPAGDFSLSQQWYTGCYNLDCTGFMQTNHNWMLGGTFDHYSTTDGPQWGFEMQWKLHSGKWWLFLKGSGDYEAVGYYPTSIYNGGQLSSQATEIIYGGEVVRKTGHPWPQMGSGAFAAKGWQEAAFQKLIFWIPRDESGGAGVWANLASVDEALASCYTINIVEAPDDGDWGTYIFSSVDRGEIRAIEGCHAQSY